MSLVNFVFYNHPILNYNSPRLSLPLPLSVLCFFLQYLPILNTIQFTYLLCILYITDLSALESKFHEGRDFCLLIFQAPGRSPDIEEEFKYFRMNE